MINIRVVPWLTLPQGNPEGNLDAYTVPGDMQLLESSWLQFFDPAAPQTERSIDLLILHEVLRTTGNTCNDDRFVLSLPMLALLRSPSTHSQIFKFSYSFAHLKVVQDIHQIFSDTPFTTGACEEAPKNASIKNICFSIQFRGLELDNGSTHVVRGDHNPSCLVDCGLDALLVQSEPAGWPLQSGNVNSLQVSTLLGFIRPDHPFYILIDLDSGDWSYGFDPANLIPVPL